MEQFEKSASPKVEVEVEFSDFIPQAFLDDPAGYFEREGENVKPGEIKFEHGMVREDPTAVKDLPIWKNEKGDELSTVGKRVNVTKALVGESGDPFYEFKILEELQKRGLPATRPVAKAEQGGVHIIVTERIPGMRWREREMLRKEHGYSDVDMKNFIKRAEKMMGILERKFGESGVIRLGAPDHGKPGWKLGDMVFQMDFEKKIIKAIIPTDWERTTLV